MLRQSPCTTILCAQSSGPLCRSIRLGARSGGINYAGGGGGGGGSKETRVRAPSAEPDAAVRRERAEICQRHACACGYTRGYARRVRAPELYYSRTLCRAVIKLSAVIELQIRVKLRDIVSCAVAAAGIKDDINGAPESKPVVFYDERGG